jgi:hypothetical protein
VAFAASLNFAGLDLKHTVYALARSASIQRTKIANATINIELEYPWATEQLCDPWFGALAGYIW